MGRSQIESKKRECCLQPGVVGETTTENMWPVRATEVYLVRGKNLSRMSSRMYGKSSWSMQLALSMMLPMMVQVRKVTI